MKRILSLFLILIFIVGCDVRIHTDLVIEGKTLSDEPGVYKYTFSSWDQSLGSKDAYFYSDIEYEVGRSLNANSD